MFSFKNVFSFALNPTRRLWGSTAEFVETPPPNSTKAILSAAQVEMSLEVDPNFAAETHQMNILVDRSVYTPTRGQDVIFEGTRYTIANIKRTDTTYLCEMMSWPERRVGAHGRSEVGV